MPFIIKVDMRHSRTGPTVRTIRRYNNFVLNRKFNSMASTFSFDFYFDPTDRNAAEMICVSHLHECIIYYTSNKDPNHSPLESERILTGFLLRTRLTDKGVPDWVKLSGYSKPGVLHDCDIHPNQYPLEIDGLTFKEVVTKVITPFGLRLVVNTTASAAAGKKFSVEEMEQEEDDDDDTENVGKTAAEGSENAGAYITNLACQRNIVMSHTSKGDVYITTPNTKGEPILVLDFTDKDGNYKKIPGVELDLDFNAQPLHSTLYVKQQASDDEGTDPVDEPLDNPLLPVRAIVRPKVHMLSSGNELSAKQAVKYELGKEIREAIPLEIRVGAIELNGKLIAPNNSVMVRNPNLFLYTLSRWFIQAADIYSNDQEDYSILHTVLPFGYDFDEATLKNVFVDPHENLPRF